MAKSYSYKAFFLLRQNTFIQCSYKLLSFNAHITPPRQHAESTCKHGLFALRSGAIDPTSFTKFFTFFTFYFFLIYIFLFNSRNWKLFFPTLDLNHSLQLHQLQYLSIRFVAFWFDLMRCLFIQQIWVSPRYVRTSCQALCAIPSRIRN